MTVILGGGMSGLSAAYYATEKKLASLVLLEASDRLGGWVCSKKSPNGSLFEIGPRTIRPRGPAGKNTLNLIDDLKLTDKLIPIPFTHPSAKNRMIYVNNKLHLLPNSFGSLIATKEPFKRALINIWLNDVKAPKVTKDDESIYSFVERRMGKDVADYLISPMLCGICAGDAKKISVNFLMGTFFEAEQKYGSIMKGLLASKFEKIFSVFGKNKDKAPVQMQNEIVGLKSAKLAEKEQWSVWGLSGGLEQLPIRLSDNLKSRGVDMRLNEKCEKIKFVSDGAEIEVNNETRKCSRIISALSAKNLAQLVHVQHPQLAKELWGIPMVNVGVVNLEFPGNRLPMEAFGFLVPPMEKIPILGVIFDSCVFPSKSSTVRNFFINLFKYCALNNSLIKHTSRFIDIIILEIYRVDFK